MLTFLTLLCSSTTSVELTSGFPKVVLNSSAIFLSCSPTMSHWSSACGLARGLSTLWLWLPVDGDSADSPGQQLEALRRLLWRRRRQGQWQGADRVLETTSGRSARLDPLTSAAGAGCSRPSSSGSETAHDHVNAYYLGQDNRGSNWYRTGLRLLWCS